MFDNFLYKAGAIKNFISFVVPLSFLMASKNILPNSMYESLLNFNANQMTKKVNRGLDDMYTKSICPKIFLDWSTENMNGIKSVYESLLLELNCKALKNTPIENIECVDFNTLKSVPLLDYLDYNVPTIVNIGSTS